MIARAPMMIAVATWALMVAASVFPAVLQAQRPQARARTVWDGVYTAAQAKRGQPDFEGSCAGCHGPDLAGRSAPALKGDSFVRNWEAETMDRLFAKLQESMPLGSPETVSDEKKLDIMAYILEANAYPAGSAELKSDAADLERIEIVRKGSTEVPNFVLVQALGCLVQAGGGKGWQLTNTTAPVVTKEDAPTGAVLKEAAARPLGTETFSLVSVARFDPTSHRGHKMEARGLLHRADGASQLDLVSLQMVSPTCAN